MNLSKFSIPNLHFNFSLPVTNILLFVLLLAVIIFGVISSALIYHWRKYGMGRRKFFFVQTLYICVALVFIAMALISIIFI